MLKIEMDSIWIAWMMNICFSFNSIEFYGAFEKMSIIMRPGIQLSVIYSLFNRIHLYERFCRNSF
ncbi:MAG: hypothetical protein EGQ34_00145 [Sutterella sp.]|nr:hypothetical protein [Sutterella sp.]